MFIFNLIGVVSVRRVLDRETTPVYNLMVTANDGSYTSTASLIITLLDVNDEHPTFTKPHYSFSVSEGATPGKVLGVVSAVDDDLGVGGQVTYRIVPAWGSDLFSINAQNGIVSLAGSLNFEDVIINFK